MWSVDEVMGQRCCSPCALSHDLDIGRMYPFHNPKTSHVYSQLAR